MGRKKLRDICIKKSSNISANTLSKEEGKYKMYGATGFLQNVNFYKEEESFISIVKDGAGVGRILLCQAKSSVLGTLDIIKPLVKNNLSYLYYLLCNFKFHKYSTGSTIPHIYFKDYAKETVYLPIVEEQKKLQIFSLPLIT